MNVKWSTENDKRVRFRTHALYINDIHELRNGATISKGLKRRYPLNECPLSYFQVS